MNAELQAAYLRLAEEAQGEVDRLELELTAKRTTRDAAVYDSIRHGARSADVARRIGVSRAGVLKIERREELHREFMREAEAYADQHADQFEAELRARLEARRSPIP